eukprot:TRINITY_DN4477_c0_g1_i1.p2 TRINITY_DN4477_c0_g1~~TRINITY_DN4477_c0_g1_i1.p2  ORF type:complete len:145 (-),score=30.42 TRINITY_DN4477_c0_g1_i1:37-471(-)
MCEGNFTPEEDARTPPLFDDEELVDAQGPPTGGDREIALGCEDGRIYLLEGLKLRSFIKVGYTVTTVLSYQPTKSSTPGLADYLICAGYFNAFNVYYQGTLVARTVTSDWVHTISIGDVDEDSAQEVVVGTLDNYLLCYKFFKT